MSFKEGKLCRSCLDKGDKIKWFPLCGKILNVDIELKSMLEYCTKQEVRTKTRTNF